MNWSFYDIEKSYLESKFIIWLPLVYDAIEPLPIN